MNRMANYDRIVFEHFEDGFYIVHDEGWTSEEWQAARHVCSVCGARFVILNSEGRPISGNKQRYCSQVCSTEGKRRAARQWASRRRAA